MKPYLIGISGGSASGKTSILERLVNNLPSESVTFIAQDNYYRDLKDQKTDESGQVNFDHPDAVDLRLLHRHLLQLLENQPVSIREYHFNNPTRMAHPNLITYRPAPVIILEGIFTFYNDDVRKLLDLKVFIEADEHLKLTRRIRRDGAERGYPVEEVLTMYENHVMPMYRRFVEPFKYEADILLMNNQHYDRGTDVLLNHIRHTLNQQLLAAKAELAAHK